MEGQETWILVTVQLLNFPGTSFRGTELFLPVLRFPQL